MPVNRIAENQGGGRGAAEIEEAGSRLRGESTTAGNRPVFPQQMLHRSCNFTQELYKLVLQVSSRAVQSEGKAELKKEIPACGCLAPRWQNTLLPHSSLGAFTPDRVCFNRLPESPAA